MSATLSASTLLAVPMAPLMGAALAGLFGTKFGGNHIGRKVTHSLTILGVLGGALAFGLLGIFVGPVLLGVGYTLVAEFAGLDSTRTYRNG